MNKIINTANAHPSVGPYRHAKLAGDTPIYLLPVRHLSY